jgi:uncharacterized protein (DUF4415 family)
MKEVESSEEIPQFSNEAEEAEFWASHSLGETFLEKMKPLPEDILPPARPRTQPISLRLDSDVLERVRALAETKHKGYQTLMKEFVVERLYEEEKREGILPTNAVEEGERASTSPASAEKQSVEKTRDWQSEAFDFVKENQDIYEEEDLDFIVSSRVLNDATSLLLEISNEIKAASKKEKFPPARLARMMKGYKRLSTFVESAFAAHEKSFGKANSEIEELERLWEEAEINTM